VTEKSFNDLKTFQFNSINSLQFMKITEGTKIVFKSCFNYIIELSLDLLNNRIYSDYKQVLFLIQSERPALARQLVVEVINYKLH
jgi:hypothetical protein